MRRVIGVLSVVFCLMLASCGGQKSEAEGVVEKYLAAAKKEDNEALKKVCTAEWYDMYTKSRAALKRMNSFAKAFAGKEIPDLTKAEIDSVKCLKAEGETAEVEIQAKNGEKVWKSIIVLTKVDGAWKVSGGKEASK